MNNPFDEVDPPELALRAADELRTWLRAHGEPLITAAGGGKMFGVLVAADRDGHVRCLRAFSGMLGARWIEPGFVPPVFDLARRAEIEVPGEALVKALTARVEAFRSSRPLLEARLALSALDARHAAERLTLQAQHAANKAERAAARRIASSPALDQLSRADAAEKRNAKARWREERVPVLATSMRLERELGALERLRRIVSQALAKQIFDTYVLTNWRGDRKSLRELFPAGVLPSSGTADCAAPKLLAHALRLGLRPLAIAELWWGPPPLGGARVEGAFYPACRDKCGPILPFMLDGLDVPPPRRHHVVTRSLGLDVIHADDRLIAIHKPAGLLSVPGKVQHDSVLTRVRAQFPHATGPLIVHRLDADTSGILLVALDVDAYHFVQPQFARRDVRKQYVAWLDGQVRGASSGVIDLPIRVDLEQRPRQIVDFEHGRRAITRYEVLETRDGRTRIAFHPLTGRTHQLRVHAAHRLGLNAPITGDPLYGTRGERLMLHAERLTVRHPDGHALTLQVPAPF